MMTLTMSEHVEDDASTSTSTTTSNTSTSNATSTSATTCTSFNRDDEQALLYNDDDWVECSLPSPSFETSAIAHGNEVQDKSLTTAAAAAAAAEPTPPLPPLPPLPLPPLPLPPVPPSAAASAAATAAATAAGSHVAAQPPASLTAPKIKQHHLWSWLARSWKEGAHPTHPKHPQYLLQQQQQLHRCPQMQAPSEIPALMMCPTPPTNTDTASGAVPEECKHLPSYNSAQQWQHQHQPQLQHQPQQQQQHRGPSNRRRTRKHAGPHVAEGDRVNVRGYGGSGVVRFVGLHFFKQRPRVGVEFDTPVGKNNGTVNGHTYFDCDDAHGVLVVPAKITLFSLRKSKSLSAISVTSSSSSAAMRSLQTTSCAESAAARDADAGSGGSNADTGGGGGGGGGSIRMQGKVGADSIVDVAEEAELVDAVSAVPAGPAVRQSVSSLFEDFVEVPSVSSFVWDLGNDHDHDQDHDHSYGYGCADDACNKANSVSSFASFDSLSSLRSIVV